MSGPADIGLRMGRPAPGGGPMVQGFAGHGFRVDGVAHAGVLLTPLWARAWDAPDTLDEGAVAPLLEIEPRPEFILLGTGRTLARPSPAFMAALERQGIGVEAMDSRAAARTWGVLRSEGRWIAAALRPLA